MTTRAKTTLSLLAASMILFAASQSHAALISLNSTQNQTTTGQNFTFTFGPAPLSSGGGTFILHARGDYGDSNPSEAAGERLTWNIESIASGGPVGGFDGTGAGGVGGPFDSVVLHVASRNYEFTRTYSISAADLLSITSDGSVSISVDLGSLVNAGLEQGEFVEVTLQYQVPEPGTLALLSLGLAGLAASCRRKQ